MRKLPILLLSLVLLLGGSSFAVASHAVGSASAVAPPTAFTITGVDLHDGMMLNVGSTYYLYGTEYGCGFTFLQPSSGYCGEWVRSCTTACMADSNGSNWTDATDLVNPAAIDPYTGQTWDVMCVTGNSGFGCFNPRMVDDNGSFTLWWSGTGEGGVNGYEAFSCSGPMGPCTTPAPGTNGGKPILHGDCAQASGDFTITNATVAPVLFCTTSAQTLSEEQLNNGSGDTGTEYTIANVGGLTDVEAPGSYTTNTGRAALTYSTPNCAYCAVDNTGFDIAPDYAHPFLLWGGQEGTPGQPRTVSELTNPATGVTQPWQGYDLWNGSYQETTAGVMFMPILAN